MHQPPPADRSTEIQETMNEQRSVRMRRWVEVAGKLVCITILVKSTRIDDGPWSVPMAVCEAAQNPQPRDVCALIGELYTACFAQFDALFPSEETKP